MELITAPSRYVHHHHHLKSSCHCTLWSRSGWCITIK